MAKYPVKSTSHLEECASINTSDSDRKK